MFLPLTGIEFAPIARHEKQEQDKKDSQHTNCKQVLPNPPSSAKI